MREDILEHLVMQDWAGGTRDDRPKHQSRLHGVLQSTLKLQFEASQTAQILNLRLSSIASAQIAMSPLAPELVCALRFQH